GHGALHDGSDRARPHGLGHEVVRVPLHPRPGQEHVAVAHGPGVLRHPAHLDVDAPHDLPKEAGGAEEVGDPCERERARLHDPVPVVSRRTVSPGGSLRPAAGDVPTTLVRPSHSTRSPAACRRRTATLGARPATFGTGTSPSAAGAPRRAGAPSSAARVASAAARPALSTRGAPGAATGAPTGAAAKRT